MQSAIVVGVSLWAGVVLAEALTVNTDAIVGGGGLGLGGGFVLLAWRYLRHRIAYETKTADLMKAMLHHLRADDIHRRIERRHWHTEERMLLAIAKSSGDISRPITLTDVEPAELVALEHEDDTPAGETRTNGPLPYPDRA